MAICLNKAIEKGREREGERSGRDGAGKYLHA